MLSAKRLRLCIERLTHRRSYGYEEEISARKEGSEEVPRPENEADQKARAQSRGREQVGAAHAGAEGGKNGEKKADCEVGSEKSSQEKARCPSSAPGTGSSIGPTRRGESCPGSAQPGVDPWRLAVPRREPVITAAIAGGPTAVEPSGLRRDFPDGQQGSKDTESGPARQGVDRFCDAA